MACRSFTEFLQCERGGGTIFGLFWFIVMVGITGLAVDITDALRTQTMLQATADAAAHAAVQDLPDEDAAVASALMYADKNMPFAQHGVVLRAADVQIGVWDPATRSLVLESGLAPNAVLVTLRRTGANGNALALNFLSIAGVLGTDDLDSWDITAQSVSVAGVAHCLEGGFIAAQQVYSGSTNDYVDEICIHGQLGVTIQSTNYFEIGVGVTMFDVDTTFVQSQDNTGIDEALDDRNFLPPLPPVVGSIVTGLINQTLEFPDYIVEGRPVLQLDVLPDNPSTDYFYIVTDKVDFGSDAILDGLAVVSRTEIVVGSASTITNTFLASNGDVTLGADSKLSNVLLGSGKMIKASSHNVYGSKTYCDTKDGEVQMFAVQNIELQSYSTYSGVQIVSGQTVKLGSNLPSLTGISVQAGQDIYWGSAELYGGCGGPISYNPRNVVYIVN